MLTIAWFVLKTIYQGKQNRFIQAQQQGQDHAKMKAYFNKPAQSVDWQVGDRVIVQSTLGGK